MKKFKKLMSIIISTAMIITVIPQMAINVQAAQLTDVAANGADGSELRPYIIDEADDLVWLGEQVEAGTMGTGKHFMQIKDIDLSGYTWIPIGSASKNFNGNYNGNGYTISNLTISKGLATRAEVAAILERFIDKAVQ